MCSVAPNLPSASARRPEHSPAHKVSWEGEETREQGLERVRDEREEEWGQRAFEVERTQRDNGPQGKTAIMCMHIHTLACQQCLNSDQEATELLRPGARCVAAVQSSAPKELFPQ